MTFSGSDAAQVMVSSSSRRQRTLACAVDLSGIGVHRGEPARVRIHPAPAHTGIVFVRKDLGPDARLAARADNVTDTRLCTTLGNADNVRVQTIEHLLAALYGLDIDNAEVQVWGPEIPIVDGSAAPFVGAILRVGTRENHEETQVLSVTEPIEIRDGARSAALLPPRAFREGLEIECTLDFDHPLIPTAPFVYAHSPHTFVQQICRARTFGFLHEVQTLRAHGLALGGSLDNAVVFDGASVKSPGGLRYADECARHKILDALGDLSLVGQRVCGRLRLHRSGHHLHVGLAQWLLANLPGAPTKASLAASGRARLACD